MSGLVPGALVEGAPLLIRERTGRKRAVTLRDRALPLRSSAPSWTDRQRSEATYYPGNPIATRQLFGASLEAQTTFSGVWRDRYLVLDDQPVVEVEGFPVPRTAEALVRIFRDLLRSGAALEVTWSFFRRIGVLAEFSAKPERTEDIGWELVFEWDQDGEAEAQRKRYAPELNADRIAEQVTALSDEAALDPIDTLTSYEAKLFAGVNAIEGRVTALLEDARVVAGVLRVPAQVVQSVRASATSIAMLSAQLIEESVGSAYVTAQVVDELGPVLRAETWRREMAYLAAQLRESALDAAMALEAQREPDPVRIVTVDQSGSLRVVAQKEYGNADAWQTIADANGFEGAQVAPGTEVFIPARPRSWTA